MSIIQTIVTSLFHGHSVKTDPMPDFNLERYLGEWHEIARLENWFERGLRKVLARYDHGENGTIPLPTAVMTSVPGNGRRLMRRLWWETPPII